MKVMTKAFVFLVAALSNLSSVSGQGVGVGALCSDVDGSLTCSSCPGCDTATCAAEPVELPPKSPFWPPEDILQRSAGPDPIPANLTAEYIWFQETVLDVLPKSTAQSDTKYALTETEEELLKMSLPDWQAARADGTYTCEEMATAVTKRAMYLQDIQKMNHFMYWSDDMFTTVPGSAEMAEARVAGDDDYNWIQVVLNMAADLDAKAEAEGIDAIAPLYCYPVPLKGTLVTTDFPSSSGFAVLHDEFGTADATLVTLIKEANGVLFGKTNVPELAHSFGTGNYANGLAFNPWDYDMMTGGSSGGSGAAVAAYTATVAITEDTQGSTNTPAARNHLFGYDPPKFHYPNTGNPSLTVRNDQLGLNARNIDDIIAFDAAVLGTAAAHAEAKAYVDGLANSDIKIGCSDVYYDYDKPTEAIKNHYDKAVAALKDAGFTFVEECQTKNPIDEVPNPEGLSEFANTFEELTNFIHEGLGLPDMSPWEVLLNGAYDFGTTLTFGWMWEGQDQGCALFNKNTQENTDAFLGPIPANRSEVYNEYFDEYGVDLMMGPSQYCNKVLWTEDIGGSVGLNEGCDGGSFESELTGFQGCMGACHSYGITGSRDKTFTKAKFVVPVGLTEIGEPVTIHFMSRAGPRDPTVPPIEWVYDQEGPKTWNLVELYMIERISDTLAEAGMGRADAPLNEMSGLNLSEDEGSDGSGGSDGDEGSTESGGSILSLIAPFATLAAFLLL